MGFEPDTPSNSSAGQFVPDKQTPMGQQPIYGERDTLKNAQKTVNFFANVPRALGAIASLPGGITAPLAGLGESGGQLINSFADTGFPKITSPGAIVTATGLALIPGSSAETIGARTIGNLKRFVPAGILAPQVQSLIDTGKPSSVTSSVLGGVGTGLLVGGSEALGALAGRLSGNVSSSEARNLARLAAEKDVTGVSPTLQNAQKLLEAGGILPPSSLGLASKEGLAQKTVNGVKMDFPQQASVANEAGLRAQVRKQLGLTPDGPINQAAIEQVDKNVGATYQKVRDLSPQAESDFASLTATKAEIRKLWKNSSEVTGDAYQKLKGEINALQESADNLNTMMIAHAAAATDPKLAKVIQDYHKQQDLATQVSAEYIARHQPRAATLSDAVTQSQPRPNAKLTDKELQDTYQAVDARGKILWDKINSQINPTGNSAKIVLPPLAKEVKTAAANYAAARKLEDLGLISWGPGKLDLPAMAERYKVDGGRANMIGAMGDAAQIAQTFPQATQNPVKFGQPASQAEGIPIPTKMGLVKGAFTGAAKGIWGSGIADRLANPVEQQRLLMLAKSGQVPNTSANPELVSSFLKAAEQLSWQRKATMDSFGSTLFNLNPNNQNNENGN